MNRSMPGLPVRHQLPEFTQTHVHWVSDAIQPPHLCRPLLLLPSVFPSIKAFSNESALTIRWSEYWSFSFSISPSNEHPGLISFRMDWFDLLAVQGTLKSLQHHSSKASVLQHSAFFIVQPSHPYMTTGKTIRLKTGQSNFHLSINDFLVHSWPKKETRKDKGNQNPTFHGPPHSLCCLFLLKQQLPSFNTGGPADRAMPVLSCCAPGH